MGSQVEREVEGTDGGHGADREAPGDAQAPDVGRPDVQRDRLAHEALRFLGREAECQGATVHLDARVADGLASLTNDGLGDLIATRQDARGDGAQGPAALVGGQQPHGSEPTDGRLGGLLDLLGAGQVGAAGQLPGMRRVGHLQDVGGGHPAAGQVDGPRSGGWAWCGVAR